MAKTYTINELLNTPQILSAVIDRVKAVENDTPFWRQYLDFQMVSSDIFATAYGSKSGARMGSVIADYANKPLRGREGLVPGQLQVANLGDRFQLGRDDLENLQSLINRMNSSNMDANSVNEVTDYLANLMADLINAPHNRMDKVVADLFTTGASSIRVKDNPKGVEVIDIEIPTNVEVATKEDKGKVFIMLQNLANKYRRYNYREVLMSNETFAEYFMTSPEFKAVLKAKIGESETSITGLVTEQALSTLFTTVGLPPVRIVSKNVITLSNEEIPLIEKGKLAFVPASRVGLMRWRETYESGDPVPGKVYTRSEGGILISSERTNEGRFLEYECKWVPEIREARAIVSIDLTATLEA